MTIQFIFLSNCVLIRMKSTVAMGKRLSVLVEALYSRDRRGLVFSEKVDFTNSSNLPNSQNSRNPKFWALNTDELAGLFYVNISYKMINPKTNQRNDGMHV